MEDSKSSIPADSKPVVKSNSFPSITKDNNNDNNVPTTTTTKPTDFKKSKISSLLLNNDSIFFREQIIKELKITHESDTYQHLINENNEDFNNFVKIKIINESKVLENLKSQNLDKLSTILDKCIDNNKFDNNTLNNILNFINNNNSNNSNKSPENRSPSPLHSSTSNLSINNPNNIKKRKLEVPINRSPKLASPRGHRRYKSEIPSINEMTFSAYPPPPPPSSSNNINNNTSNSYPLQPYQLPAPGIPPPPQHTTTTPSWQSNNNNSINNNPPSYPPYPYGSGYPPNDVQNTPHGFPNQSYYGQQGSTPSSSSLTVPPYGNMGGYNRQNLHIPTTNNENLNPLNNNNNTSTNSDYNQYFNIPSQFQQQQQQQSLPPPQPSPYRQTTKISRRGHRRSQSANVTMLNNNSNNGTIDFRSPQIFNTSNTQKPVNFLIHTPKHPPPS